MNFEEFKKVASVRNFVGLYQHFFRLFLITKGYFSKNLPYNTLHEIYKSISEIIQIPSDILESLQTKEVGLDAIGIIDGQEVLLKILGDLGDH